MHTKVKTTVFAKQLRTRLEELKRERTKELDAYHKAVREWRLALATWIKENGGKRILAMKPEKERNRYGHRGLGFSPSEFFEGAPASPEYPTDKVQREIQALLRQLGITGQATVTISTEDMARYFGDARREDD